MYFITGNLVMVTVNSTTIMDLITEMGLIGIIVKAMKVGDLEDLVTTIKDLLIIEVLIVPLMEVLNHKEVDGVMKILMKIGTEFLKIHLPT